VEDVRSNFTAFNLPLDILWMDIDYMQNWKDFTYDSVNFPQDKVLDFINEVCVCERRSSIVQTVFIPIY
jgi:alpha-glucosidase